MQHLLNNAPSRVVAFSIMRFPSSASASSSHQHRILCGSAQLSTSSANQPWLLVGLGNLGTGLNKNLCIKAVTFEVSSPIQGAQAPNFTKLRCSRLLQPGVCVTERQANSRVMQGKRLEVTALLKDKGVHAKTHSTTMKPPLVKICGVMNVTDATLAAQAGATFVGMILWPRSKRSISVDTAKEIAHAVRLHKAEPVGVFVDENAETIERVCTTADIGIAQLHGEGARASLANLPAHLDTIYVLHVDKSGILQTPLPESNWVDWILLDSLQGGSGNSFDWDKLKALSIKSRKGWLLAGGLNPENVTTAISILKPDVVDVSSGVTMSDGLSKDPARVSSFMDAVKGCC